MTIRESQCWTITDYHIQITEGGIESVTCQYNSNAGDSRPLPINNPNKWRRIDRRHASLRQVGQVLYTNAHHMPNGTLSHDYECVLECIIHSEVAHIV